MSRLNTAPISEASGQAAQLFAAIKSAVGMVPNAYAGIGSLSPVALESALHLDGALRKSSLSAKEIEAIKLAVSEQSGCDYCLAAHSLMGKKVGLSAQAIDDANGNTLVSARARTVCGTRREAFGRSRCGIGVRKGESVSTSNWSSGVRAAASRR